MTNSTSRIDGEVKEVNSKGMNSGRFKHGRRY